MTYREIDPNLAGIYIFKNNINGKCYVGQSVSLRKRIKHHLSSIRTGRYDLPIYRAINKYGLHNFTIDILESFIPDPDLTTEQLVRKLDEMEIKYIEEYNAYTEGYNCTKGGDYGVLGLKMTPEQRKKVSENTKKLLADGVFGKRVYMYNFEEKYYIYAWTIKDAANITGIGRSNISRLCNGTYVRQFCKNFIAAYSEEKLQGIKEQLPSILEEYERSIQERIDRTRNGQYTKSHGNSTWVKGMIGLNKGKKMSEEQKEKLRKASTRYIVYQYTLDNILVATFEGMHNAAKAVNTDYNSIKRACNGKARTCKGYIWKKELMQSDCKQIA